MDFADYARIGVNLALFYGLPILGVIATAGLSPKLADWSFRIFP